MIASWRKPFASHLRRGMMTAMQTRLQDCISLHRPPAMSRQATKPNPASRNFVLPIVLLCAMSIVAHGQTTDQDSAHPTLEEVKAAGALTSSYRDRKPDATKPSNNGPPKANLDTFRKQVEPILNTACLDCHGPDTQEGNIRIDTLDPDLFHGEDVDWWIEVLAVIGKSEMPPVDADELADDDRAKIVEWLTSEIQLASMVRRAEGGHSSFRRMTRYEYKYTLQDLLGLPLDFSKDLPPESNSEDGFQNSSEMLHMSVSQFGTYRESALNALRSATVRGERPKPIYWGIPMQAGFERARESQQEELNKIRKRHKDDPEKLERELKQQQERFRKRPNNAHYRELSTGLNAQARWSYGGEKYAWTPSDTRPEPPSESGHIVVIPRRQKLVVELGDTVPNSGTLRVRVRASHSSNETEPKNYPSLQLEFGWQASNDSSASIKVSELDLVIAAPPKHPQFYQWEIPLSEIQPRNSVRNINKMGDLPSPSEYIKLVNSSVSQGDIQIDYIEITAPVYDQWPTRSHKQIFFDSENKDDEAAYAREILTRFMPQAWRRKVTNEELEQKLKLFDTIRPTCDDFQDAMVEVLATVLSSPKFLYLVQADSGAADKDLSNHSLSPDELATRLSMFLWSSTPDDKLLDLVAEEQLGNSEALVSQVQRMSADPRSQRFSQGFMRQWLGMQLLDYLDVDRKAYRQFDTSLKEAMQQEPIAQFHESLQKNHSVVDFIHTDYAMANERLAKHYGLSNVYGNHFRRVALAPQDRRGGLLTQAGLLAMNSDGKDSHPLKRGIWMLENLLNDPPPPPPPAVPEIDLADPEIAKLTLKERIEDHRNDAACMSCHEKIDPWGIAFENFDAVGSWRTEIKGKPVDASSHLFNGQQLDGMDGLKRFLLKNRQDQFVRAMVHKMTTYALGRPLTFGDRAGVDQITARVREQGDGLATMVEAIVTSELFRSK